MPVSLHAQSEASYNKQNFQDMAVVAKEAAKLSNWTGAVSRQSFWKNWFVSCEGLNYQSPISEASGERLEFLRTDGYMPAREVDQYGKIKAIPVANFVRTKPKKATLSQDSKKGKLLVAFKLISEPTDDRVGYNFRITRTTADWSSFNGFDWPAKGTFYTITFEVRTDWEPHPFAWARLPLYGPFLD
jgi:hypothetical protein